MNKKILAELAEKARGEERYPNPIFPPSPYYQFLKLLAKKLKPKVSVELGVCGGGGSLHLAIGYPKGQVIGVDHQNDHPEHMEYLKRYTNLHFLLSDSTQAARKVHKEYGKVDILFIDTDHTYERTLLEYRAWKPFLSRKAVVCFDDLFRPGMQEAWDYIEGKKTRFDHLHEGQWPEGGGFGVVWK